MSWGGGGGLAVNHLDFHFEYLILNLSAIGSSCVQCSTLRRVALSAATTTMSSTYMNKRAVGNYLVNVA